MYFLCYVTQYVQYINNDMAKLNSASAAIKTIQFRVFINYIEWIIN